MSDYEVVFGRRAERQLDRLYAWLAENRSDAVADGYVGRIVDRCLSLRSFPERGTTRDDIRPGLRTMGHERRVTIAFLVEHDARRVVILGVFYGGQDFEAAL